MGYRSGEVDFEPSDTAAEGSEADEACSLLDVPARPPGLAELLSEDEATVLDTSPTDPDVLVPVTGMMDAELIDT